MILPGSYAFTVILLILSLVCWGSWANSFKLAGKWRFELYYFDFVIGAALAALIAALTFGSVGWDGFSFLDDVRNSGKRQELFAFLGGAVFNLGNMLLLAAVSLAGLSVAFPIGLGVALVVGVIWGYFTHPGGNPAFLAFGCIAVVAAIVLTAMAYRANLEFTRKQQLPATTLKGKPAKRVSGSTAILLALVSGFLMGSSFPLIDMARETENGLGPYGTAFIFSFGMVATTFVYSLFFMNLPVQGQPVEFGEYFKGGARQHGLGILGGMVFSIGTVASLVAAKAEGTAHAGPAISFVMGHGPAVIAAVWGLIAWKEFADADGKVKTFLFLMLVLFAVGIGAVAIAPHFSSGS